MSEKEVVDRKRLSKAVGKGRNGGALAQQHGYDEASFDNNYPPRPTPPPVAAATDYRSGSPYRPLNNSSNYSLSDPPQPYVDPRYSALAPGHHYPIDPYGQPIMPPSGHHRMGSGGSIDSGYDTPGRRGADMSSASINGSPARLIPNAAPMPVMGARRWEPQREADFSSTIGAAMLSDDDEPSHAHVIGQARGGTPVEDGVQQGAPPGRQEIEAPLLYPSLPRDDVRNRRLAGPAVFQDSPPTSPTRAGRDSRQRQRTDSAQSHYYEARTGSALSNHSDRPRSGEGRRSGERARRSQEPPAQGQTPGYAYDSAHGVPGSPPRGGWRQAP